MKGMPAILLMLTIFAGGCSIASVDKPFDHNLMKEADYAVEDIITAAKLSRGVPDSALRPLINLAWAKYYAGNVALAEGEIEKATTYLEEAIALVREAAKVIIDYYENLSPKPKPLLQGGALL